ncbi:hypothetical protein CN581_14545 [Bacillus toyonensis]|nr:hypothetical protein CN581_14545 [Bacillus toyonensis]
MKVSNKSKVFLSRKLWEKVHSKDDLKQTIVCYIHQSYPGYRIEKVIKENESYIAICTRR